MPNEVLQKVGTAIVFADSTDYPSVTAANSLGTRTHQLLLENLAAQAARMSAKADLTATWARRYAVMCALEWTSAPTAGGLVYFYWAPSPSVTAGTANPGGVTGVDAAYTGYSSNMANSVKQLMFIGAHVCTAQIQPTAQISFVGTFSPPERYGSLVVRNETTQALNTVDANEMSVLLSPIIDEVQ